MNELLDRLFAGQESLDRIGEVRKYVNLVRARLELELARTQANSSARTRALDLSKDAPGMVANITQKVEDMQLMAASTMSKIDGITKNISRLDRAKDNLVQSITMLKRLQMLTKVYSQIDYLLRNRQYAEMSRIMAAATELTSHFKPYRSLPQVARISKEISGIENRVYHQIEADFAQVLQGHPDPFNGELASACRTLDCIDTASNHRNRKQLVSWYCETMLRDYVQIFGVKDEAGSLENLGHRFNYLMSVFNKHSDYEKIFPPEWNVGRALARCACAHTRKDVQTLLREFSHRKQTTEDMQVLLAALRDTAEFEQKIRRSLKLGELESDVAITPVYYPYLSLWIGFQDRQLAQKVQYQPEEDEDAEVLPSSAALFLYYQQLLGQMSCMSKGEPLFELSKLMGKWLTLYCQQVLAHYISAQVTSEHRLKKIILVLKTSEYCLTTTQQLQDTIIGQCDDEYKDKIDFESQRDEFLAIINRSITAMASYVGKKCEPSWREMAAANWSRLEQVGERSVYVGHLCKVIEENTKLVFVKLPRFAHCRMVCDRIVESMCFAFVTTGMRAKPVSEIAAQQMLMDLYGLKETLLNLLALAPAISDNRDRLESYQQRTLSTLAKAEAIFKVLLTRLEPPDMFVNNYLLLIRDRSLANFCKILDAKGLKTQTSMIEIFKHRSTDPNLHLTAEHPLLAQVSLLKLNQLSGTPVTEQPFRFNENFNLRKISDFIRGEGTNSPLTR